MKFLVPGNPIPKARPRVVNGHAYTESRTELAEAWIAMHARKAKVRWTDQPVALRLAFFRKDATPCDLDNLVKLAQDALNSIAWKDDRQIVSLAATKDIDRENYRTEIEIEEVA